MNVSLPATSLLEPGVPSVDFYAPRFRVSIAGRALDPETLSDVLQVKVTMQKDGLTSFSMTLNNWDETVTDFPKFKYSDSDTFNIGTELRIEMGYADQLVPMLQGQINSLTPKFPESGAPSVEVSGTDTFIRMRGSKPKDGDQLIFVNQADWQIAQYIADKNGIPIEVTKEGPTHERVVQPKDQSDAEFLLELAKRNEFDLFMKPESGTIHFVKPTDGRDGRPIVVYDFAWGRNLIEFNPKLSATDQVSSVTVRGWDPQTKQSIVYTATAQDLPQTGGGGDSGPQAANKVSARGKEDVIVNSAVISVEEARRLAVSQLVQRAYKFKTGSGRIIGQPKMRPGDNVQLSGLGKRFSGSYQITKVEHSIGGSGYTTSFDVESLREME
ncbi:phage late control D family protein [Stieleria varia]|uniref:Phage late control protein n=1 Tax=Stieleria varia TaxID=2528005 RepID=A0A5C5ZXN2_9BACT|nr:phage late control D family protein [Stieleria varia]TWT91741.1 Phage late control protein [Stieleria varia]